MLQCFHTVCHKAHSVMLLRQACHVSLQDGDSKDPEAEVMQQLAVHYEHGARTSGF